MLFPENLKSVEIQTREDGDDYLVGILEDGKKQKYKIQEATKETNGLRFVEKVEDKENKKQKIKFFLVEEQKYIEKKLKNEDYNFSKHVFLIKANFKFATFTKEADFRNTTFTKEANFFVVTFNGEASFLEATFTKEADFIGATFEEKVYFLKATFTKEANFFVVTFTKEASFSKATFTKKADFSETIFTKEASFSKATFIKEASFVKVTFEGKVEFWKAIFTGEAGFGGATFTREADFERATFKKKVIFLSTTFTKEARFSEATFTKETIFFKATFTKKAKFTGATFIGEADFRLVTFTGDAGFSFINILESSSFDFRRAIFDNKFILNLSPDEEETEDKKFKVLFEDVVIEAKNFAFSKEIVEYLSDESDRYIFLNMKNAALARQDNITALELHKREYDTHYRYLKEKNQVNSLKEFFKKIFQKDKEDNFFNFLLLGFEKYVSNFGTDIYRSLLSFIFVCALFVDLIVLTFQYGGMSDIAGNGFSPALMYALSPITFTNDFLKETQFWWVIVILKSFKNILLSVLAYEVIKSFRKFSRKL